MDRDESIQRQFGANAERYRTSSYHRSAPDDPAADTFLNCIELLRDPSHVRDHTVGQWQTMFADAGLSAVEVAHWAAPLPFGDWTERMQTPEPARLMLRRLFDGAPAAIGEAFRVQTSPHAFAIPIALLRAGTV